MDKSLSSLEEKILNRIQTDFPLSADPYDDIGREVGCKREETHAAVVELRRRGIIRRIGGIFAADKLGYESCLVAVRVAPGNIEEASSRAGSYPEVTHSYERDSKYNLWFTIIAEGPERTKKILDDVRECGGVEAVYALRAIRTFKIRVDFDFGDEDDRA